MAGRIITIDFGYQIGRRAHAAVRFFDWGREPVASAGCATFTLQGDGQNLNEYRTARLVS